MVTTRKNAVKFKGNPVDLEGPELKVGDKAPVDFALAQNDMSPLTGTQMAGSARIVAAVPSLDTGTCDLETRRFNEEAARLPGVKVYTVSMDLPFAQKRWCGAAGIERVVTLSDFKDRTFGRAWGAWIPSMGLLTRAVFVVDKDDTIRHVEYVSEIGEQPDYGKAIDAAKKLG
jgi:thiol peroxidase